MSSTDPRDEACNELASLLLQRIPVSWPDAKDQARDFIKWQLSVGWRPPPQPVRDWRDTRRLAEERVRWHADQARAALNHPTEETTP